MYLKRFLICVLLILCKQGYSQNRVNINIGNSSTPESSEVKLKLKHRLQHYNKSFRKSGNICSRFR